MPVRVSRTSTLIHFVSNLPINELSAFLCSQCFMSYSRNYKYNFYLSKLSEVMESMNFNFVHFKLQKCYVLQEGFEGSRGLSRWTKQVFVLEKNRVNLSQCNWPLSLGRRIDEGNITRVLKNLPTLVLNNSTTCVANQQRILTF